MELHRLTRRIERFWDMCKEKIGKISVMPHIIMIVLRKKQTKSLLSMGPSYILQVQVQPTSHE
jgi:hypothetical protein